MLQNILSGYFFVMVKHLPIFNFLVLFNAQVEQFQVEEDVEVPEEAEVAVVVSCLSCN